MNRNSTIKPKIGICPKCSENGDNSEKYLISGLCANIHYRLHRIEINVQKRLKRENDTVKSALGKVKKNIIEHISEDVINYSKGSGYLWRWFQDRRVEMTGRCAHCGAPTPKNNDQYFHFSIAHILPKSHFASVKTNPDNWVELCSWGNNCHGNYDNSILDLTELNCFDEVVVKFQKIYPFIAASERRRIPNLLLQYLNTDQ